ncbi:nicotinate-nucleotide pyrophosphorylase [carboxylating] [Pezoporus wallicus]|uniref:nicotinate-nucleotide pyrophosphorylase [carboxylating] n=1 Tax=Pezoporus wallicus TaxID=35540 RepID=UPI00254AE414|nr:nicotinate-nucleotide pyrophosphorylase [carboxylating] [Pezoporus wallicus]XP_061300345.1 nicotinate-nucleotide pyrophosphorylase [carboxylating] [Pezoporus flaviventris]
MEPPPLPVLPPPSLRVLALHWLQEDTSPFDPASSLSGDGGRGLARAQLVSKSAGVLAGLPFAEAVFRELGCELRALLPEGSALPGARTAVAELRGPAWGLLYGERVALNCLGRCSGVATMATAARGVARARGWHGLVAGTRKTTPGFRLAEKYALAVGGADAHRWGLDGLLLVKDNHVALHGGSMEELVGAARAAAGFWRRVSIEVGSEGAAVAAAAAGADIVLMDNFSPQALHKAAAAVKASRPHVVVEASGGITLDSLPHFLGPHIDVVSMGCLTHSAPALDFALKVLPHSEQ